MVCDTTPLMRRWTKTILHWLTTCMDGYPLNELFKCLAFISTGLAAVWLLLYSSGRCLRRLRVRQEYAAALVLMRAPSAMRDALCACRTHIVEAGEAPPATGAHSTR